MSASGPGSRSLAGLAWLARVGAASARTWAAAVGWSEPTARSHTVRLQRAGLLSRARRLQGAGGPLLYATPLGLQETGVEAVALRRAPAPITMAHHEACAQTAAYLTLRDREMIAPRELLLDERWVGELEWEEHGQLRRRGHRPDFIATVGDGRSLAIEVELTAKSPARLRAVLGMYAAWLAEERIDSLLYVVGGARERRQLMREAPALGIERGRRFGVQLLGEIVQRIHPATPASAVVTSAPLSTHVASGNREGCA